jgi:hypothetical protein
MVDITLIQTDQANIDDSVVMPKEEGLGCQARKVPKNSTTLEPWPAHTLHL